jgi:hypothetical protein
MHVQRRCYHSWGVNELSPIEDYNIYKDYLPLYTTVSLNVYKKTKADLLIEMWIILVMRETLLTWRQQSLTHCHNQVHLYMKYHGSFIMYFCQCFYAPIKDDIQFLIIHVYLNSCETRDYFTVFWSCTVKHV